MKTNLIEPLNKINFEEFTADKQLKNELSKHGVIGSASMETASNLNPTSIKLNFESEKKMNKLLLNGFYYDLSSYSLEPSIASMWKMQKI